MPYIILVFWLLISSSAYAVEPQYRQIDLVDGRSFIAEIISTEQTGLLVKTRQGESLISFEALSNLHVATYEDMQKEAPAYVWIASNERKESLEAIYRTIPNTEVIVHDASTKGIENCAKEFQCASVTIPEKDWYWIVVGAPPQDDSAATLTLRSATNRSKSYPRRTDVMRGDQLDLVQRAYEAIELTPPEVLPQELLAGNSPERYSLKESYGEQYTPIPGYTALRKGKIGGFVLSSLITVAGTGLTSYALHQTKQDSGRIAGGTIGSYYVLSVATNHLFLPRKRR